MKTKRILSLLLAVILLAGLAVSVNAASFSIPQQPLTTDDGVIKVTASRAGQIAPLILGCNLVGSSNLGASNDDYNKVSSILGVFGSDINANPDPYLYNHNYNFYAADNGLSPVENATIAEEQSEGASASTEAILNILTHRPDLILNQGGGTGNPAANETYSNVVATLPENVDEDAANDYTPSYYTCSISTLVYQCENLKNLADIVNGICAEKGLTTRYGDPHVIATDYDKFVWGYYFYVQKQLAEGGIAKKSVAVVGNTEDEGANWTLPAIGTDVKQSKPNRLVEYVRDNTNTLNTTEETTAALADILACDVVIANRNGQVLRSAAAAAGVDEDKLPLIIDTLPTCLYGMIMQTHENALGIPYIQSIIYGDEIDLNPVYAAAYYYQNFFHITDEAALQETVSTLLEKATLPQGVTTSLNLYDPKAIEEILVSGITYALSNGLKRHDDPDAWAPDMTVGIGAGTVIEPQAKTYADVAENAWYFEAVKYVTAKGLFQGVGNDKFDPDRDMTMAELLQVLYRIAGNADVKIEGEPWYTGAKNWAIENELITESKFKQDEIIDRETFICMLHDTIALLGTYDMSETADITGATDYDKIDPENVDAIAWSVAVKLIVGTSADSLRIDPAGSVTRAQTATMLMRYYQHVG
ncbi:MAG: S-layer homology domain-containing protein [Oscillospiraceae bacterium]|nr:S-layer homology domain-containing protein [Oscillospiraceae bacterium]